MFAHRQLVSGRIPELLDNLKAEFESLAHDVNMYKMQRDDYERKLQSQLGELSNIQQTLYDLERNHTKLKGQYEEDLNRMRRQLEIAQGGSSDQQPPDLSGSGTFRGANNSGVPPGQRQPGPPTLPEKSGGASLVGLMSPFYPGGGALDSIGGKRPFPAPSGPPKKPRPDEFYSTAPAGPQPPSFPPLSPMPGMEGPKQHKLEKDTPPFPVMPIRESGRDTVKAGLPPMNPELSRDVVMKETATEREAPQETKPRSSIPPVTTPPAPSEELPKEDDIRSPDGSDWIVGYNPGVQTNLNIDLLHDLDHNSVVCCVRFSHDGKYLSTGCNKSAQIYDVETGAKIHTFSDEVAKDCDLYIRSVCFSPDGLYLATGAEDKTVKLWDIAHKRVKHTFVGHELDIYSLDFSGDGKFIVSGSGDKKAKIWDLEKGKCAYTLGNEEIGPRDGVTSVAISPDGRLVAAGSLDRVVRLWDAQTGYFLERYEGHLDSVYSVAFSPDGKSLASGSLDKTLKLWDLSGSRRSRCRATFNGHKDFVLSVAFSPDGNWLISGSKDRAVQFWDPRTAVTHMMLQGHKNSVISVASSPAGGVFATGSGDYRARLWRYSNDTPR